MKTIRGFALFCLVAGILGTGCAKKINSRSANLLVTVRVSLATTGVEGNAEALKPELNTVTETERSAVSDDGRFVVFSSKASNLVAVDINGFVDVFRRDNVLRVTEIVSINSAGTDSANGPSRNPSMSADGNFIVWESTATNLTADVLIGTGPSHIYIRNMTTGVTTLVSRASGGGAIGNGNSNNPFISSSGRYVVWDTTSTNFDIVNDTDNGRDVYRRDLGAATLDTILISRRSGLAGVRGNGASVRPSITADGRLVCFQSDADNLPTTTLEGGLDGNLKTDIFVRDTATGSTIRVSVSKVGDPQEPDPNGISENGMISADGNFVVYRSTASNIVAADDGPSPDIFLRDLVAGTTEILSVHSSGAQAGNSCNFPRISANGHIVVWD
ncbi:MAG: PD40 domain-containing protein [Planctomycetes bacterium]|nr:PD40 domain-containing protein [Planctomycetota bacterium]